MASSTTVAVGTTAGVALTASQIQPIIAWMLAGFSGGTPVEISGILAVVVLVVIHLILNFVTKETGSPELANTIEADLGDLAAALPTGTTVTQTTVASATGTAAPAA